MDGHRPAQAPAQQLPQGNSTGPLVSVIVLNWNGKRFLDDCLTALRQQTLRDFEVIVVDSGSTDGSAEYVRQTFPESRVIALPENRGFCGGNNAGIRAAQGRYIALLNNDTRADPHWLAELVESLDARPQVGFCACKILLWDRPQTLDAAGDVFYPWGIAGKRGAGRPDGPVYALPAYVFGACAGAALYRRTMLDDIGLLDEDFFAYDEDVDLSFRAQLRGYRCLYVPMAMVWHHRRGTTGLASTEALYLSRRNAFYVLLKDMPAALLLALLPLIVGYHFLGDLRHALSGQGRAVWRARADGWRCLRPLLARRRDIQAKRTVSLRYLASILGDRRVGIGDS